MADHWRGERHGRVVVETRGRDRVIVEPRHEHDRVIVNRGYDRHIYVGNGDRFYFNGGHDYRVYQPAGDPRAVPRLPLPSARRRRELRSDARLHLGPGRLAVDTAPSGSGSAATTRSRAAY